jgi:hypothetical protein
MADKNLIVNYDHAPFYLFQWILLGIQVYMIYNYKYVNELMDKYFDKCNSKKQKLKKIILSIPFLLMVYYDIRYSSFSLKNLGISPVYNNIIKQILNIFGSYGIIYIFAQDSGLKTTTIQTHFIQTNTLFIIISVSMAYSITQNRSQSLLALLLFYHLKYVISQNIID